MIHVEEAALSRFEEEAFVFSKGLMKEARGVGNKGAHPAGVTEILVTHLGSVENPRFGVEGLEITVLPRDDRLQPALQVALVEQLAQPDAGSPADLVLIAGPDTAPVVPMASADSCSESRSSSRW